MGEDDDTGAAAVAAAAEALAAEGAAGEARVDARVEIVRAPFRRNMKGYEDQPTLLMTGETLLNVSRVVRDGADAYRQVGTPESPGTKFFQVTGSAERPGIYELPLGTPLRVLIDEVCGGVKEGETLKAVIVGGIKGACLKPDELDLSLDFDSVRGAGGPSDRAASPYWTRRTASSTRPSSVSTSPATTPAPPARWAGKGRISCGRSSPTPPAARAGAATST